MTTNEQWIDELIYHLCRRIGQDKPLEMPKFKQTILQKLQEVDRQARIDELKRFDRSSEEMTKLIPLKIGERLYELTKQEEQ